MSDVDSNKVERLYVSEEGEVSLLPHRPDLPCEGLWGASVVERDSILIMTGCWCESVSQSHVWTLDMKASGATWQASPRLNTA